MPTLILLCGMMAESWYAWLAFRSRVSMSAIGSVMVMSWCTSFSVRFPYTGTCSGVCGSLMSGTRCCG